MVSLATTMNNWRQKIIKLTAVVFVICIICVLRYRTSADLRRTVTFIKHIDLGMSFYSSDIPNWKCPETSKHDKWIVLTTISPPTEDVKFLSKITGWKVVVVGDTKTPQNWSYPNCDYLSVEKQKSLGFQIVYQLPYKSYARKNVGYLYAVACGAKVIYETDDDNRPLDLLQGFYLNKTRSGLLYAGNKVFNPYKHFGQSTLWPRGYPLGQIGLDQKQTYRLRVMSDPPAIQQGLVNGDPDMDAIFRLTRKKTLTPLEVEFDHRAPPAVLPDGVFSPFNSQNTLFHYKALWAMFIPTTTAFRVCDIWRGYWAQRLLWEIGGQLAFFPPNAYQLRNAHSYMDDAVDEKDLYFEAERLLDFLRKWTCPRDMTFFQCVYKLSRDMASEHFWLEADADITRLWLRDLEKSGYLAPRRVFLNESIWLSDPGYDIRNHTKDDRTIIFSAVEQNPPTIDQGNKNIVYSNGSAISQIAKFAKLCSGVDITSLENSTSMKFIETLSLKNNNAFKDILLIIVFNFGYYSNVDYIEAMYSNIFPNMIYCGLRPDRFEKQTKHLKKIFSFIEAPEDFGAGAKGYACMVRAMQMSYKVSGYFAVGDDCLINPWKFQEFDKNNIWITKGSKANCSTPARKIHWVHWQRPDGGSNDLRAALADLKKVKSQSEFEKTPSVANYIAHLNKNSGYTPGCAYGEGDVYYVPISLASDAYFFLNFFYEHGIFLEIAVPMVLNGLTDSDRISNIKYAGLWGGDRNHAWKFYNTELHYIHPIKFSHKRHFFDICTQYSVELLRHSYS